MPLNKYVVILKCLLLSALALLIDAKVHAQRNVSPRELDSLVPQSLSKEVYVDSLSSTVLKLLRQGRFFERETMLKGLAHYRNIVWDDKKYLEAKSNYFIMLGSNAGSQYKTGEAVYYFEKLEELRKEHNMKGNHQFVLMQKCYLYANSGQYEKVIQEYLNQKTDLDLLPQKITAGKIEDKMEVFTVLSILKEVGYSYSMTGDSLGLEALIAYKDVLIDAMLSEKNFNIGNAAYFNIQFVKYSIDYFYYRILLRDKNKTFNTLHKLYHILNDKTLGANKNPGLIASCESWLTDYYIFINPNADSARFYLERYKNASPSILSSEKQSKIKLFDFQIWALRSKNAQVIPIIESFLNYKDSTYNLLAQELDKNLYAQTKAEYTTLELDKAEKERKKWNMFVGAIALLVLLTAIIIYARIKTKSKRIQLQIDIMNNVANLKIAAMEEAKHLAVKEEQEKIAQELHDDFSGRIAGVKHHLDSLIEDPDNINNKTSLKIVQEQLQDLYHAARDKSHQWFYSSMMQQQISFHESVYFLVNSSLADKKFKKNIQIDADAVIRLSFEQRINMLRILQEGLTNIIKHSKADEVSIFLFKNGRELIFEVGDNGAGVPVNRMAGIGIESIKKRVLSMNGHLEIIFDEGFVLSIKIPIP